LETKQCTKCLASLPLTEFYSKGNRTDARCKACVKSEKKTKYVSREIDLSTDRLMKIFDIVFGIEKKVMDHHISRLDEVILKCQRTEQ
jgi:hypothetical protein